MSEWNPAPFQRHLTGLAKDLGRHAFWKTALFGTVLLERQWLPPCWRIPRRTGRDGPWRDRPSWTRPWGPGGTGCWPN